MCDSLVVVLLHCLYSLCLALTLTLLSEVYLYSFYPPSPLTRSPDCFCQPTRESVFISKRSSQRRHEGFSDAANAC